MPGNVPTGLDVGELGIDLASPPRLWVGCPAAVDASGLLRLHVADPGGPYLPLTGGTLQPASGGNPLTIQVAQGNYANIVYNNTNIRTWTAGPDDVGRFIFWDGTASRYGLIIGTDGNVTAPGSITTNTGVNIGSNTWLNAASGSAVIGYDLGVGNQLYVGGPGVIAGNLSVGGTGYFANSLTCDATIVGDWVRGTSDVTSWLDVTAYRNINCGQDITASRNITCGQDLDVDRDIRAHRNLLSAHELDVGSDCRINGSLQVGSLGANIYVMRADPVANLVNVAGGATFGGDISVVGSSWLAGAHLTGGLTVLGAPWANQANFNVISDRRVKRNIVEYHRGLEAIRQLRPVAFEFNGAGGTPDDGVRRYGLVADEVAEVIPEMVGVRRVKLLSEDEEATDVKTLQLDPLTYALVNAVQTLAEEVDQLWRREGRKRNG